MGPSEVRILPYAWSATHAVSPSGGTPASKSGVGRFDSYTACFDFGFWIADFGLNGDIQNPESKFQNELAAWPNGKGSGLQIPRRRFDSFRSLLDGECSSSGRAPGCEPGLYGFEPRHSPSWWHGRLARAKSCGRAAPLLFVETQLLPHFLRGENFHVDVGADVELLLASTAVQLQRDRIPHRDTSWAAAFIVSGSSAASGIATFSPLRFDSDFRSW